MNVLQRVKMKCQQQSTLHSFFSPASDSTREDVVEEDVDVVEADENDPKRLKCMSDDELDDTVIQQLQFSSSSVQENDGPSDLGITKHHSPCQPVMSKFPSRTIAGKQRSFNSTWYTSYSWLEYSVETDACFCFPCRMFHVEEGSSKDKFTKLGFRDWKHVTGNTGILRIHDRCLSHR